MVHAASNGGPYGVYCSGTIAKALRLLQRRASAQGRGEAALAALRQIAQRLRHDPNDFGEALYRLPALRMQIRCGVILPMIIHFAVCEDRPLVIVKWADLVAEH
jgi:hypothetical protein